MNYREAEDLAAEINATRSDVRANIYTSLFAYGDWGVSVNRLYEDGQTLQVTGVATGTSEKVGDFKSHAAWVRWHKRTAAFPQLPIPFEAVEYAEWMQRYKARRAKFLKSN